VDGVFSSALSLRVVRGLCSCLVPRRRFSPSSFADSGPRRTIGYSIFDVRFGARIQEGSDRLQVDRVGNFVDMFSHRIAPNSWLTVRDIDPVLRFSARDNLTAAKRIRFKCAVDSRSLRRCPAVYRVKLHPGRHVGRVRAVDRLGNESDLATFRIRVKRARG